MNNNIKRGLVVLGVGGIGTGIGTLSGYIHGKRKAKKLGFKKGSKEYNKLMRKNLLIGGGSGLVGGAGVGHVMKTVLSVRVISLENGK